MARLSGPHQGSGARVGRAEARLQTVPGLRNPLRGELGDCLRAFVGHGACGDNTDIRQVVRGRAHNGGELNRVLQYVPQLFPFDHILCEVDYGVNEYRVSVIREGCVRGAVRAPKVLADIVEELDQCSTGHYAMIPVS